VSLGVGKFARVWGAAAPSSPLARTPVISGISGQQSGLLSLSLCVGNFVADTDIVIADSYRCHCRGHKLVL